ncbi:uncharacterized protein EKO05_0007723 [Ascochyta rabiei]|uniref:Uncharacterized protein n=1 Tax=Didymella rabiei TaxID=5454 RepID=A0A163CD11_DIDRA|nr:uncharacterized protein EKO05_0007723 [Ascochyta rabiei]KZM22375.1 hypothetical protein ST47_g6480 [Ascochyta rabiei]UPX17361.1 hypothetical protein EKO05_0007723 [Ascochyta rabiei]
MAPKSFHTVALTPVILGLKNAAAVIRKGEAHAKDNNVDPTEYLSARLYPDMGDFCYQIYRFTDTARYIVERSNPSVPTLSLPDVEITFPDLLARVHKTLEYVESIEAKALDGREDDEVVLQLGKQLPKGPFEVRFTAFEYVLQQAHPNFWFHVTTMYGILRHSGVPLGKLDYSNGAGLIPIKWLGLNTT